MFLPFLIHWSPFKRWQIFTKALTWFFGPWPLVRCMSLCSSIFTWKKRNFVDRRKHEITCIFNQNCQDLLKASGNVKYQSFTCAARMVELTHLSTNTNQVDWWQIKMITILSSVSYRGPHRALEAPVLLRAFSPTTAPGCGPGDPRTLPFSRHFMTFGIKPSTFWLGVDHPSHYTIPLQWQHGTTFKFIQISLYLLFLDRWITASPKQ